MRINKRINNSRYKGSITVEATLIMPIILCVFISFIILIKAMNFQQALYDAMCDTAQIISDYSYSYDVISKAGKGAGDNNDTAKDNKGKVNEADVEKDIKKVVTSIGKSSFVKMNIKRILDEKADNNVILGGFASIDFMDSQIRDDGKNIVITADYCIQIPFIPKIFSIKKQAVRICTRAFTGDSILEVVQNEGNDKENVVVYVTPTGTVYHLSMECPYLRLSVKCVDRQQLDTLRNESGGIYYACSKCRPEEIDKVYICTYGNRYHSDISCSELKRGIKPIKLSQTGEKKECGKCGNK